MVERHQLLLEDNDVYVISTATALKDKIESSGKKKAALITNGVDYEHFKYRELPIPEDLSVIRNTYKTLICYYGALAKWFDYELIQKIATNKEYAVVLIGQDYDGTYLKSKVWVISRVWNLS